MSRFRDDLIERLRARQARVGVIGLGYVGLPLALEFAKAGFETVGIDLDEEKVRRIASGDPCGIDVSRAEIEAMTAFGRLAATTDFARLEGLDSINICVLPPSGRRRILIFHTWCRQWRRSRPIYRRASL